MHVICQILQHVRDRARTLARDASFHRQTQPRSVNYAVGGEQPIAEVPSTPIMERGFRTLRKHSSRSHHWSILWCNRRLTDG